ncbi:hypothetical protein [Streptomyces sp. NPDC093568]|uniref:hypothetical protein n=1 Tax=Streptomyces sp. NPDC093568 TaxID=3366041 RepID=UPI00380B14E0
MGAYDHAAGGWSRFIAEVVRLSPGMERGIREGLRAADEQDRFLVELMDAFGATKSAELRLAEWRCDFGQAVTAASEITDIDPREAVDYADGDCAKVLGYLIDDWGNGGAPTGQRKAPRRHYA